MSKLPLERIRFKLGCNAKLELLELILDPVMYIFFEKGTRDGISYIPNRYSKTNNKYLKLYDQKQ